MYVCMYLCGGLCTQLQYLRLPEESIKFPGAEIADSCKPSHAAAGKQSRVL